MASFSSLLYEEQLQCSICLDVFTDPVSTPCGHNFCKICLKDFWDNSSHYQCPMCIADFPKRPDLCVNTFISELSAQFKMSAQVKSSSAADQPSYLKPKGVLCDSCTKEKLEALRSCLDCGVSLCITHLMPHKSTAKLNKHKLIEPVENLEDYICQKHERPLELFCRDDQMCVCQFCILGDHKNHTNVRMEEESQEKKSHLVETQKHVQKMIQNRQHKIEELKQSAELNKKHTDKEKTESVKMFSALMRCIERSQVDLLKVIEEKQKATERQTELFIQELEQEINELKKKNNEMEQLLHTQDHIKFLQSYPFLHGPLHNNNWNNLRNKSDLRMETLRRALCQLQESLNEEIKKLPETELKIFQQYAVEVTLDPDTANPKLMLSNNRKQVRYSNKRQNVPDNPERFKRCVNVLGKEGFSSGRFYYDVQVRGKTAWDLGVARESINRKGEIMFSPKNGYWILMLRNKTEYKACESPLVPLRLKQAPQKVGVFVDYEGGLVSFYDVEAKSHIYSFTGQTFTEKLYPFFSPCLSNGGKNSAPLIIMSIEHYFPTEASFTE
ncbi:E3 ubiquitin-protein ligase TRIM39-like [Neoarius graeffei]|uniref:E3 ubiquitin-protein ligase TRIM39-like n=1 Tax=Neoarius graeffei TaxID=443677 RepID=UPI00298C2707|nr:E3 ubiquitin-protein ligase TRIM39-like [Neoarius graeffei]XP_060771229.1 E3 ubiquitin-protein ligase TRIM39-like [Neoarius graeffei]